MDVGYNPIEANSESRLNRYAPLVSRWRGVLRAAKAHRKKEFDRDADEARNFFDGPTNYYWTRVAEAASDQVSQGFLSGEALIPQFKISVNRMFDAVAMFGPALYHQNPTVAVTPRKPLSVSIDTFYAHEPIATELIRMIPAMQQGLIADDQLMEQVVELMQVYESAVQNTELRAQINTDHSLILESLVNYYQQEGRKQDEGRKAITEAIVTGLGLLEPILIQPPAGGPRVPSCRFISNRDFYADPDAAYWRDVTWIAIKRTAPRNVVEARFGLPEGALKGKFASNSAYDSGAVKQVRQDPDGKTPGVCHDIVEYYDIFSKNGAGQRLRIGDQDKPLSGLEVLGDYVYLAISTSCNYPLNLPHAVDLIDPETMEPSEDALQRTSWPAPFWDDALSDGGWPIVRLSFYENPGKLWPISMCKPVLPEMRFMNWCMSFLADGVAAGSKIYPAVLKSAAESLKQQLAESRGPFTVLELESITGRNINEIVSFLKAPPFNIDIWNMLAQVNERIDKGLGLTELMYGLSGRQIRSAAEANYRQGNINIRPDDMASRVEDWLSITAAREIQLLLFHGMYEDVEPIVGSIGAHVFHTQMLARDISAITREFSYRVEAGSARKPNKDTRIAQLNEIGQYLLPVAQNAMQWGVTKPFNAFIEDYGRAMDIDPTPYMLSEEDQRSIIQMQILLGQGQQQEEAGQTEGGEDEAT